MRVSESPWDVRPVIDQIQRDVTELIGDPVNGSIHVDESGFVKKGTESVGVKRQYCGRLGRSRTVRLAFLSDMQMELTEP